MSVLKGLPPVFVEFGEICDFSILVYTMYLLHCAEGLYCRSENKTWIQFNIVAADLSNDFCNCSSLRMNVLLLSFWWLLWKSGCGWHHSYRQSKAAAKALNETIIEETLAPNHRMRRWALLRVIVGITNSWGSNRMLQQTRCHSGWAHAVASVTCWSVQNDLH